VLKDYLIIHEKYCEETGRFKTYVFDKAVQQFSPRDSDTMKDFDCKGTQQPYRHIEIDLKTGRVVIMRPTSSSFDGVQFFTHNDDKNEITHVIDSNA